jgi:hypothetical protein
MSPIARQDVALKSTRLWNPAAEEPGQTPVSKISGEPWWPKGVKRPRCERNHAMTFLWQVRLAEVPGLDTDSGLVSFHYCLGCSKAGRPSFGWAIPEVGAYDVTVFEPSQHQAVDEWGTLEPPVVEAFTVDNFYDMEEADIYLPWAQEEEQAPNDDEFEPPQRYEILQLVSAGVKMTHPAG